MIAGAVGRPVAMLDCADVTGGGSCRPMRRLREWREVTLIFLCHSNPGGGSSAPHQDIALHIGISAAFYSSCSVLKYLIFNGSPPAIPKLTSCLAVLLLLHCYTFTHRGKSLAFFLDCIII